MYLVATSYTLAIPAICGKSTEASVAIPGSAVRYAHAEVPYVQPLRKRGITKSNFYALYDMAMLGITSHSKVPLRLATMSGFSLSAISLLIALG